MTTHEGQNLDCKSLRTVLGPHADFDALARDCVCFANGTGGELHIGVEDGEAAPPASQQIEPALLDKIRKRIGELTVNVHVATELRRDVNGGQFIAVHVARAHGVASTSDGRYFQRVADVCRPVLGDDILRLVDERPSAPWETMTSLRLGRAAADPSKVASWTGRLRASDRVRDSVKQKSLDELLVHYGLVRDDLLTHLGVLLLATAADRSRLGTAPVVVAIRYDERGTKIGKQSWDDHGLSPIELIDAVWAEVPDFRDTYELPSGMFRDTVPAYDEAVVRELLVNALVHRPYTQRGDIFLNLHPDRLEVVNPGRLPLGVTPRNILHASRRRNDGLARVFHDLKLMEREGSGFDMMYDRLLSSGRAAPAASEGADSVCVTVPRRVMHPGVIRLIASADQAHQLTQRERIALGLLAQSEGLSALELAERLELRDSGEVRGWLGRLVEAGLVKQIGRTKGTRYFVPPTLVRAAGLAERTTLARMQPHRLQALIVEDLERYPDSSISEVNRRIGPEVPVRTLRRALDLLAVQGVVARHGEHRWRRYRLASTIGQEPPHGR